MKRKFFALALVIIVIFISAASDNYSPNLKNATPLDLPIVLNGIADHTQEYNPIGALIVFSSIATTKGGAGGRAGMNALCSAENPVSHFCSLYEVENAFFSGVYFDYQFSESWIDLPYKLGSRFPNPDHGYIPINNSNWTLNSCNGWTSISDLNYGHSIGDTASSMSTDKCDESLHVACCIWSP